MVKPIYMMCAADVAPYLYEAVKEAVRTVLKEVGFENTIETSDFGAWRDPGYILDGVYQKYKSIDWYILATKYYSKRENQIDAGVLLNLCHNEPWQADQPHYEVIVAADDMYYGETNFVIGISQLGFGMAVSTHRFRRLSQEDQIQCIKSAALHELGHVFGAIRPDRKQAVEEKLGTHCTNVCVMRQGLIVPNDWLRFSRERLRTGQAFCEQCLRGMRECLEA